MRRPFLLAKVHRVTVTEAELDYEGSLTLDQDLLDAAGLASYQRVEVYDLANGRRFATYLIPGPRGSGACCVNGAAARLAHPGDRLIVAAYCELENHEVAAHRPRIVLVESADNRRFRVQAGERAGVRSAS